MPRKKTSTVGSPCLAPTAFMGLTEGGPDAWRISPVTKAPKRAATNISAAIHRLLMLGAGVDLGVGALGSDSFMMASIRASIAS